MATFDVSQETGVLRVTIQANLRYRISSRLKSGAEALFGSLPRLNVDRASLVLAYHNIVPEQAIGHGDRSLHLAPEQFSAQLAIASQEADLVDLPTLISEIGRPGRRVAITFDDAYLGCLKLGLPACSAYRVVPTVFVAPALLGRIPAWDLLAEAGQWSAEQRERFLLEKAGRANNELQTHTYLPPLYRIGTESDLTEALTNFRFHIGNHTNSHPNLEVLDSQQLEEELSIAVSRLRKFGDALLPYLAYPYGRSPQPQFLGLVGRHCEVAFLVHGGWIRHDSHHEKLRLPRMNIPAHLSIPGFRARLRGWLGWK